MEMKKKRTFKNYHECLRLFTLDWSWTRSDREDVIVALRVGGWGVLSARKNRFCFFCFFYHRDFTRTRGGGPLLRAVACSHFCRTSALGHRCSADAGGRGGALAWTRSSRRPRRWRLCRARAAIHFYHPLMAKRTVKRSDGRRFGRTRSRLDPIDFEIGRYSRWTRRRRRSAFLRVPRENSAAAGAERTDCATRVEHRSSMSDCWR